MSMFEPSKLSSLEMKQAVLDVLKQLRQDSKNDAAFNIINRAIEAVMKIQP